MADIDYSIKDVEKHVKVDGVVKNIEVSRLTAPGENFISLVLRVNLEVEKDGVSETFSTVAKRLPLAEGKSFDYKSQVMTNEIKWYSEIISLIKDFGKEEGIAEIDFFPEYCGSRYSFDSSEKAADRDSFLLLENLIPQGFRNEDRHKGFDLISTKAVLKRLALFHSVPIAMKFKKPGLFKVLREYLGNNMFKISPENVPDEKKFVPPPGVKDAEVLILEAMMNMPECAQYVHRLKPLVDKPKCLSTWHIPGPEPWSTVLHNDFWINNIMVNIREGKEPLVKILDFQVCTYGTYAKDLIFFLLTSVDNEVTKRYMDDLLRYYYEEFTGILIKTNVDLELTYTAFLKEIQRVALESEFYHVLFFSTIIFAEKGTAPDTALEELDLFEYMASTIKKMSQLQKNKLILIASEATQRNWI